MVVKVVRTSGVQIHSTACDFHMNIGQSLVTKKAVECDFHRQNSAYILY